jgi:hypothetical protein
MPATDAGWRAWSGAEWTERVRGVLDGRLGIDLDYGATIDGDWTAAVGQVASEADEGMQIAVDSRDPARARGAALDAAVAPIVYRRQATSSRYTVTVDTATTLPTGALYRDPDAQTWVVVAGGTFGVGDEVVVEAQDAGVIALSQSAPTTLVPISALVVPTDLTYTPGDDYTIGRDIETDSQLRRRWSLSLGRPRCPTGPGIRRTLLAVEWVIATSAIRTAPGVLAIYVAPTPVGTDRQDEIAAAIYSCVGASTYTDGSTAITTTGADGRPVVIRYTGATTQAVTTVLQVVLATGVALDQVLDAIEDAIGGVYDALEVGDTLRRLEILGALASVAGVVGFGVCTLDGGTADITPASSTTLLVLGTLTVTV